eukprot:403369583
MSKIQDFQIINKLGEGAYSQVYKVKRISDKQIYALKKVSLDPLSQKERQNALNEVRILASIQHPNVVGYKEAFVEDEKYLNIIMDYADDGDLYQKIVDHQKNKTNFDEDTVWRVFIHLVKGLKALHKLKIFHRDMKSANVFLCKDGTAKLGDLNVSKVAKKGLLYTQTGTPYYASPEVWKDQPYDQKSDLWSLGCVLYEIVTLQPPFTASDMDGLFKKVLKGNYPKIPAQYTEDLNKTIKKLINVNSAQRPTCDQLLNSELLQKWAKKLGIQLTNGNDGNGTHVYVTEELQEDGLGGNLSLLNTIKLPKNLKLLTDRLPKSKYEEESGKGSRQILLNDSKSVKSIKTMPDDQKSLNQQKSQRRNKNINQQRDNLNNDIENQSINATGQLSQERRSALSEERKQLKRNASENLRSLPQRNGNEMILLPNQERIRDKNSQDYLETIRENEQLLMNIQGKSRAKKNQIKYHESDDSYDNGQYQLKIHATSDVQSEGGVQRHYYQSTPKRPGISSLKAGALEMLNQNNNSNSKITKPNIKPVHSIDVTGHGIINRNRYNNNIMGSNNNDLYEVHSNSYNVNNNYSKGPQRLLAQDLYSQQSQSLIQPSNINSITRKPKKRAPLLVANAYQHMQSQDRATKNQSELGSLKLPEIKVAHYKNFGGSSSNNGIHSRDISINGTDDKKERLRQKLEMLYNVKMPKQRSMKVQGGMIMDDGTISMHQNKPPLMIKKNINNSIGNNNNNNNTNLQSGSYLVSNENGIPAQRPQWWG